MSLRKPMRMGPPKGNEPPNSVLELEALVEFDHDPTLSPEEMAHVNLQVGRRIAAALHENNLFADLPVADGQVYWQVVNGRGENTPVFPVRLGGETIAENLDLVERVERASRAAGLGHLAYDLAGRAYEMHAHVEYVPQREMDRARGPGQPLPPPRYDTGLGATADEIEAEARTLAEAMAHPGHEERAPAGEPPSQTS